MRWLFCALVTISVFNGVSASAFTNSICDGTTDLKAGDWLVLDIDGTLVTEPQMFGRDQWYHQRLESLIANDRLTPEQALVKLRPAYFAVKEISRLQLIEPCLLDTLDQLRERGVYVFALTGRSPRIADPTLKMLAHLGIQFSLPPEMQTFLQNFAWPQSPRQAGFKDNVIFADGADKGLIIDSILQQMRPSMSRYLPGQIRMYDDTDRSIAQYNRVIPALGIVATAIPFRPASIRTGQFQMAVAEVQMQNFVAHGMKGPIMTDAQAVQQLLSHQDCGVLLLSRAPYELTPQASKATNPN